ncbi:Sec1-like protein [Mariannaea sp. PMI_226]|nr:Sec1-like protein [Mariannaea sp. PMI_226]
MGLSVLEQQENVILDHIKNITRGDWKCLIVDENSKKIIDNAVKEDDILNNNIATIERIDARREPNPGMDAIYILSPDSFAVECLLADFEVRRYRSFYLIWTGLLDPSLRRKLDEFPGARQMRAGFETLFIDFIPRESHLVTFQDPWSFPMLYHPACNALVPKHMKILAQKIAGLCITLGEYPKVRYYKPMNAIHEASVLCAHLARFVQEELDAYAQWDQSFPPPSQRPQSTLVVTDRSMDLMAPLVHEFSYQAMAHDLLPIKDADKVTFHTTINEGTPEAEEKDMELSEKDKIWVENRHLHMKDTIDKLMGDFQKFLTENGHFTSENADPTNLNTIRDMLAGLPQFQEMKEAYSLHLSMAQECMNIFQKHKLPDIASIEQTLATGLDEDFKKPKDVLDTVARLLDDESVTPSDRLRLIIMFILYRDGVISEDIKRLLAHADLPQQDGGIVTNMEHLGGRMTHGLKDARQVPPPLFPIDTKTQLNEEYGLSRFEPVLKQMLDALSRGVLDQTSFPFVKPPLDPNEDLLIAQGGSLRTGRPNWASQGRRPQENRQRLIIFMAGGATYSESRACYEIGAERGRDVILTTSHMLTPQLFIRQVGDLSREKRQLDLPMERLKARAPAHLFERPAPARPPPGPQPVAGQAGGGPARRPVAPVSGGLPSRPSAQSTAPPTAAMSGMSIGSSKPPTRPAAPATNGPAHVPRYEDPRAYKEKKRRNLFGIKK